MLYHITLIGYRGVWFSWCTRGSPATRERLSGPRVSSNHLCCATLIEVVLNNFDRSARGAKVGLAKQGFASYGDKFEAIDLNDVATDDITEHLVGVTAVIHTAAPLSNRGDPKVILTVSIAGFPPRCSRQLLIQILDSSQGAIDGSINIIRQAEKAGIKKIVYTSSITAVFGAASGTLTAEGKICSPNCSRPLTNIILPRLESNNL